MGASAYPKPMQMFNKSSFQIFFSILETKLKKIVIHY